MNDKEAIDMMRRCAHEIRDLRRHRDAIAPQAEAYQVIRAIVGMLPQPSQGYSEDLVWRLEKKIAELEAQPAKDPS